MTTECPREGVEHVPRTRWTIAIADPLRRSDARADFLSIYGQFPSVGQSVKSSLTFRWWQSTLAWSGSMTSGTMATSVIRLGKRELVDDPSTDVLCSACGSAFKDERVKLWGVSTGQR